ncbi:MAG: hypothetical protein H7844_12615 [Nitrospirae bacterium YQR-1]
MIKNVLGLKLRWGGIFLSSKTGLKKIGRNLQKTIHLVLELISNLLPDLNASNS